MKKQKNKIMNQEQLRMVFEILLFIFIVIKIN